MVTIVCVAGLLLSGCNRNVEKPPIRMTREESARNGNPQQAPPENAKPPDRERRTLTLNQNDRNEAGDSGDGEKSQSKPLYQGRESLLYENLLNRIMPEDFLIGKLQDDYQTDAEKGAILEQTVSFLDSFANNKIEAQYLHPDWRTLITRSLASPGEEYTGFDAYRIGEISAEETRARMNIRLFSETGRSEGEVFLEKEGGTWYISDIQIELSKLLTQYEPEGEFEPSTYRWLEIY